MELKGPSTGRQAGELLTSYVCAGGLRYEDVLCSSFNWQELLAIRQVCPAISIALLDGAIRRRRLLEKTGPEAEHHFARIFAYGNEEYMLPRFPTPSENRVLLETECGDARLRVLLAEEIEHCLAGHYYTETLLDAACEMHAESINLWYRSVTPDIIGKAHRRGLKVLVYTINLPDELLTLARMGVDGIFTDYYADARQVLIEYIT